MADDVSALPRLGALAQAAPKAVAALLLASASLVGCGSMAPVYERPTPPVAATFPSPSPSPAVAADASVAAELGWRQFFADATLQRLIEIALQHNRDLRLAVLAIEQVRAQADLRQAEAWPLVNAGLSASRVPKTGGGSTSTYSAGVLVTAYELDLFGRLRSASDAALAQLLGSEEARKAVQIGLVSSVASTWLALRADAELLLLTQLTLASREASLRLIRLRFENGVASQLDLRQAESLFEAARVVFAQATRQRALDENALVLLLGQAPPPHALATLVAESGASAPPELPELPAGLPAQVLVRRPDVRQAEQQLIAAHANIGAARAAFFPRITLTGSLGSASSELSGLFQGGSFGWSFVPQLLQPIFDAGRNEANLALARTARELALAQYERAIQSAFREVADALAGRATLGEQMSAQQAQLRAEQDRLRLAELRYRNGASSFLDVLDAQRALFAAQQAEVQVRTLRAQNLVVLYRVLGGGWTAGENAR